MSLYKYLDYGGLEQVVSKIKQKFNGTLSYGEAFPTTGLVSRKSYFLYTGPTTYDYAEVQNPDPAANPQEEGWYEQQTVAGETVYELSTDTTVDPSKTYFTNEGEHHLTNMIYVWIDDGSPDWMPIDSTGMEPITNQEIDDIFDDLWP